MPNQKEYKRLNNFFNSPLLFVIFCFFYPLVFLVQVNSHLYTGRQIGVTLLFMFTVFVIATFIFGIIVYFSIKLFLKTLNYYGLISDDDKILPEMYRAILAGLGTLIFSLLLHKTNRAFIPIFNTFIWGALYLIVAFILAAFAYKYRLKLSNFIFCVLIIINGSLIIINTSKGSAIIGDAKGIKQNIVFKQKPNVYFVVLESYASLDNRKITYGIDNAPLIKELNQKKYIIYKTYSNYQHSLASAASIFMMDHHYYKLSRGNADGYYRNIIGNAKINPVVNIFLNNGYRINYNQFSPYLYHPSPSIETQLIQPLMQPIELINGSLNFVDKILRYFSLRTYLLNSLLWLPEKILNKPVKASGNAASAHDEKPVFYAIYAGAEHSPNAFNLYPNEIKNIPGTKILPLWKLNQIDNYWIKTYKNMVVKSDSTLIKLMRDIDKNDPEAIVLLVGDHGPQYYKHIWMGEYEDLNKNISENGTNPAEVSRDMFEVFLAIKWPRNGKLVNEYFSHVNLFRYIFAALAEDSAIIKSRVADNSFVTARRNHYLGRNKLYIVVKEGKVLNTWLPFSVPEVK